jgi:hypothetical protein
MFCPVFVVHMIKDFNRFKEKSILRNEPVIGHGGKTLT